MLDQTLGALGEEPGEPSLRVPVDDAGRGLRVLAYAGELDKAEQRIRSLRDQAMANVGGIAADTAEALIAKLTGAPASRAEVEAALASAKASQGGAA